MPLKMLQQLGSTARALGLDKGPLDMLRGVEGLRGQRLLNLQRMRELEGPGPREKFESQKRTSNLKMMFSQMERFYSTTPVGDPNREWITKMMESTFYTLEPELKTAFAATAMLRPISDQEKRRTEFRKAYPRPMAPRDENGQSLVVNAETEAQWAKYKFADAEYAQKEAIAVYGSPGKDMVKIPRLIQVLSEKEPLAGGEGAQAEARPGDFWFIDPDTRQLMTVDPNIQGIDLKKAADWGYPLQRIASTGFAPTAEPLTGVYGGVKASITPGVDMISGEERVDFQSFGTPDDAIKALPDAWRDTLGEIAMVEEGKDWEDIKDPEVANLVKILTDFERKYKTEEAMQDAFIELQNKISSIYPNIPYRFIPDSRSIKEVGWFTKKFKVDKANWSIIPADGTITVMDENGNQGELHKDSKSGLVFDNNGDEVPEARNAEDGDQVPGVSFSETARGE